MCHILSQGLVKLMVLRETSGKIFEKAIQISHELLASVSEIRRLKANTPNLLEEQISHI